MTTIFSNSDSVNDVRTTKSLALALLLSVVIFPAEAEDSALSAQAKHIFDRARAFSWSGNVATSYVENGTFTLFGVAGGAGSGTIREYFVDPRNWIEEIRVANFQKILAQSGDDKYDHQNAAFTPLLIEKLQSALAPDLAIPEEEKVSKVKGEKVDGIEAVCIHLTETKKFVEPESHRICFDSADGNLLRDERRYRTILWSNYAKIGNSLLAGHIEIIENRAKTVEADLGYSLDPPLTAAGMKIPGGIQPQPRCNKVDPPKRVRGNDPDPTRSDYPRLSGDVRMTVVLDALVGVDGRVHETQVVQSGSQAFDRSVQKTVRSWEFNPAKCDGVPQQKTIELEFYFECCNHPIF